MFEMAYPAETCAWCPANPIHWVLRISNKKHLTTHNLCDTYKVILFNDVHNNNAGNHVCVLLPHKMTREEAIEKYGLFL